MSTAKDFTRYDRQIILKGFGLAAQENLSEARVLVIGAGGLGCPALQYLVAAGVGHVGIVDEDTVSLSNLHRQVLFTTDDIGKPKAETAALRLAALNPDIAITPYPVRLDVSNAIEIISRYDIVLDGTDNFASRYLINDACVLLKKPLVFGAVSQFEGQVAVFNVPDERGKMSNYRDLFPDPPSDKEIPNCAEAGVIGVLPGIVGTMQATEVIKLITGIGSLLAGKLLTLNVLTNQFYEIAFSPSEASLTRLPADLAAFSKMHYTQSCKTEEGMIIEIDATEFKTLARDVDTVVIDVRETNELPRLDGTDHRVIPMSTFYNEMDSIQAQNVILVCQHGIRSMYAAELLHEERPDLRRIYSLKGGVAKWASELLS